MNLKHYTGRRPPGPVVLKRSIVTAQADRKCDDPNCGLDILEGMDYTLYELGWPKTGIWARLRRHLGCTPSNKTYAFEQLDRLLEARRRNGDFDSNNH